MHTWWRHQMKTFSALLAIYAGNSSVSVNSPHKGQWRGALVFSLICAWIKVWINNREAGELRRHRTHYDVIVIIYCHASVTVQDAIHTLCFIIGFAVILLFSCVHSSHKVSGGNVRGDSELLQYVLLTKYFLTVVILSSIKYYLVNHIESADCYFWVR